jgi:hypothetical protein
MFGKEKNNFPFLARKAVSGKPVGVNYIRVPREEAGTGPNANRRE